MLPDVLRTQELWRRALTEAIEEGIGSGEFVESIPAAEAADVLVGLIDGLILSAAVDTEDGERQAYRVQVLRDAGRRLLFGD